MLAVSWSAILVRLCDAPSLAIAFYRMAIAWAVVLPWAVRARARLDRGTLGLAAGAGTLLALHFATWISSLSYTTVASSVVLVSALPVFTALLAPVLVAERPGKRGWVAVALTLAGTAVLAGGDWVVSREALYGDLLALAGALTGALYLMIGRKLRDRIAFSSYLAIVYGSGAACLLILASFGGTDLHGYPAATWMWLVLIAVGPNLTGHSLLNWSVRRLRALTVSLAVLGEPLLATLYAAILFDEAPRSSFYAGAALILAGVALAAVEEAARSRTAGDALA